VIIGAKVSSRYIKPIDGLRALSIILVIFFHSNLFEGHWDTHSLTYNILNSFDAGVSFFFLISGFLITGILVDTKNIEGFFKKFYARRFLRIFPLYYLILLTAFFVVPLFDHPRVEKWAGVESHWYWLFLSNYYIALKGQFQHGLVDLSWSLSIEEQFYMIWPLVVYYLKPKNIFKVSCFGIILSLVLRIIMKLNGATDLAIHLFTFSRLDGLCLGAILALSYRNLVRFPNLTRIPYYLGVLPLVLHYTFLLNTSETAVFLRGTLSYSLVAFFFAFFFMKVISANKSIFNNRFLISIGKYSYGIYLTHYPIASVLRPFFKGLFTKYFEVPLFVYISQFVYVGLVLGLSLIVSFCIFNGFEKHFLKLKKHFEY
jgi:peptidoglycan/LPS O-acetylase OafA/YrhL